MKHKHIQSSYVTIGLGILVGTILFTPLGAYAQSSNPGSGFPERGNVFESDFFSNFSLPDFVKELFDGDIFDNFPGNIGGNPNERSPLSGERCSRAGEERIVSTLLPSDPDARPLSGINAAELVIEAPVLPQQVNPKVTRGMAFYLCETPDKVGAVRSTRTYFNDWTQSFQSLLLHAGGSEMALKNIDSENLDTLNGLDSADNDPFTREENSNADPENTLFVSISDAIAEAKEQGIYNAADRQIEEYFAHFSQGEANRRKSRNSGMLTIGYDEPYQVQWKYNPTSNAYTRIWNGNQAQDETTGEPVTAKNILVVKTQNTLTKDSEGTVYNKLNLLGEDQPALLYQNGQKREIQWTRTEADDKLKLETESGQEAKLTKGTTYIEVLSANQSVKWTQ